MSEDTKAIPDSAPPRDDSGATDGRTEEQLLADIVKSSEFVPNEEQSLPVEQVPEVDPEAVSYTHLTLPTIYSV